MSYGTSISLDRPFAEAVTAVRNALAAQGFGVLTEIDVRATMKAKLGADMNLHLIPGACNSRWSFARFTSIHRSVSFRPATL